MESELEVEMLRSQNQQYREKMSMLSSEITRLLQENKSLKLANSLHSREVLKSPQLMHQHSSQELLFPVDLEQAKIGLVSPESIVIEKGGIEVAFRLGSENGMSRVGVIVSNLSRDSIQPKINYIYKKSHYEITCLKKIDLIAPLSAEEQLVQVKPLHSGSISLVWLEILLDPPFHCILPASIQFLPLIDLGHPLSKMLVVETESTLTRVLGHLFKRFESSVGVDGSEMTAFCVSRMGVQSYVQIHVKDGRCQVRGKQPQIDFIAWLVSK